MGISFRSDSLPRTCARNCSMAHPGLPTRIVILGAGFGGVFTALHLQRLLRRDPSGYITLVDRDNYFLVTPLLFETGSGLLRPRPAGTPTPTLGKKNPVA